MLRNTYELDKLKVFENFEKIPEGLNDEKIKESQQRKKEEDDGIYQAKLVPSVYQQRLKSQYTKDKDMLYKEAVNKLYNTLNELRQTKLLRVNKKY